MERVIDLLLGWVKEDEGYLDLASFPLRGTHTNAHVILKTPNVVVSGIGIVVALCHRLGIEASPLVRDGEFLKETKAVLELSGDAYQVLVTERTILNVMAVMSGTATVTRRFSEKLRHARIAATRKVLPGMGLLQKIAVLHGGGDPHRLNLSECVMIKDNHLKLYGGVEKAIREVRRWCSFAKKIEVEVENLRDALEAVRCGVDIVMLDNLSPKEVKEISEKVKALNPNVVIEVSGGINEENLPLYDLETVDVISTSEITMNIQKVDLSLEINGRG